MKSSNFARTASVIDRILKIVSGFLIAGLILCAVFIPLTAILGEKIVADASNFETGCLSILFRGEKADYLKMDTLKLNIILTLVSAMTALAAGWYCIRVLRGILVPMKEGGPFAYGISKSIKKLGWTVLIGGGLVEIGARFADLFTVRAYRLSEIIVHPNVEKVSAVSTSPIHPWFIYAALILFFLSFVFGYGEELQRESDETL